MLVFAAEFPTAKGRRAEEVLEVARKWVRGGRTYPWAEVGTDLREKPFDVAEYVHGSHTFALASTIDQENRTLAAVRQVATTEFEWITELAALEDDTALWISVSLTCNTLYPGSQPPHPKKPYLIGLLLRELGGGEDGPFRVSDGPHHLGHQDVKMAASLVFGTAATALPIVYVSAGFEGRPVVDFVDLAKRVAGMAHVVVEPNRSFSLSLARETDGTNVYGGGVAIYWPQGQGETIRFLPPRYPDKVKLLDEIAQCLREAWLYTKTGRGTSWAETLEVISRGKLEQLRESGNKSLEDFEHAAAAEREALREQLRQTRSKLASLQLSLSSRSAKANGDGLLQPGAERDLFEGEIHDTVIAALRLARENVQLDSRRRFILDDLLKANAEVGGAREVEAGIRAALKNAVRITAREIRQLEQLGFTVEDGGKHYRATFGQDDRISFTFHKTASDHRSPKNLVSQLVNKLLR